MLKLGFYLELLKVKIQILCALILSDLGFNIYFGGLSKYADTVEEFIFFRETIYDIKLFYRRLYS